MNAVWEGEELPDFSMTESERGRSIPGCPWGCPETEPTCQRCSYSGPEFFHFDGEHLCADCMRKSDDPEARAFVARFDAAPARTDHQVLISLCELAEEQLAASHRIISLLGETNGHIERLTERIGATSQSSVEIAEGAKAILLTVKSYAGSELGLTGPAALAEFAHLKCEVEAAQMRGWQQTIDALKADGK